MTRLETNFIALVAVQAAHSLEEYLGRLWVIEVINGIGHPLWTLQKQAYTPGVATAPMLLVLALSLIWQLKKSTAHSVSRQENA